jgi:2-dehydropantoate 2-reductase
VRVLVVGAGALGLLFAARLSEHADVCIKTDWREQADAVKRAGIIVETPDGVVSKAYVPVALAADDIPDRPDVVVVSVKVYDTERKLRALEDVLRGATVVTIQNGLAQLDVIKATVDATVCAAPTYQAATKLGPARIRHAANGETVIWSRETLPAAAYELCTLMLEAGMPTRIDADGERASWEKLIVTAGLNALAAVLLVPVGGLQRSPAAARVAHEAAEEARLLAVREGMLFEAAEIAAAVDGAIERTARNYSSMTQDVLAGRPTEVDFVNGFVVERSDAYGISAPVNRLLWDLLHAVSDTTHVRISR